MSSSGVSHAELNGSQAARPAAFRTSSQCALRKGGAQLTPDGSEQTRAWLLWTHTHVVHMGWWLLRFPDDDRVLNGEQTASPQRFSNQRPLRALHHTASHSPLHSFTRSHPTRRSQRRRASAPRVRSGQGEASRSGTPPHAARRRSPGIKPATFGLPADLAVPPEPHAVDGQRDGERGRAELPAAVLGACGTRPSPSRRSAPALRL